MNTNLKMILTALTAIALTACADTGGSAATTSVPAVIAQPSQPGAPTDPSQPDDQQPSDPSMASPVQVEYYAVSMTTAPVSGWSTKTYTATAYCATYETVTYCWDDGLKTVTIPGSGDFKYSYWGSYHNVANAVRFNCSGGCPDDAMTAPTVMAGAYVANLTQAAINDVFSHGVQDVADCYETAGTVVCPNFTIKAGQ